MTVVADEFRLPERWFCIAGIHLHTIDNGLGYDPENDQSLYDALIDWDRNH